MVNLKRDFLYYGKTCHLAGAGEAIAHILSQNRSPITTCTCTRFKRNQFGKIKFDRLNFLDYFKLDFYCLCSLQKSISKLIFAGKKSNSSNWTFKNRVQMDRAIVYVSRCVKACQ